MTYTISTEPVTREHIGRKVLVITKWGNLRGPYTLKDMGAWRCASPREDPANWFGVVELQKLFYGALLIVADSEGTD